MNSLLITMLGAAVLTGVGGKVADGLGEATIAGYIRVSGTSLTAALAVGTVIKLIGVIKSGFGA